MHFAAHVRVPYAYLWTAIEGSVSNEAISSTTGSLLGDSQGQLRNLAPVLPSFVYDLFDSSWGILADGLCDSDAFTTIHRQMRLRDQDRAVRRYWGSGKAAAAVFLLSNPEDNDLERYKEEILRTVRDGYGWHTARWASGLSSSRCTAQERAAFAADAFVKLVHPDVNDRKENSSPSVAKSDRMARKLNGDTSSS